MTIRKTALSAAMLAAISAWPACAADFSISAQTDLLPGDRHLTVSDKTLRAGFAYDALDSRNTAWSMYSIGQTDGTRNQFAKFTVRNSTLSADTLRTLPPGDAGTGLFASAVIDVGADGWVSLEGNEVTIGLTHDNYLPVVTGTSAAVSVGGFNPDGVMSGNDRNPHHGELTMLAKTVNISAESIRSPTKTPEETRFGSSTAALLVTAGGSADIKSDTVNITAKSDASGIMPLADGKPVYDEIGSDHYTVTGVRLSNEASLTTKKKTVLNITVTASGSAPARTTSNSASLSGWQSSDMKAFWTPEGDAKSQGAPNVSDHYTHPRDLPLAATWGTEAIGLSVTSYNPDSAYPNAGFDRGRASAEINGTTKITVSSAGPATGVLTQAYVEKLLDSSGNPVDTVVPSYPTQSPAVLFGGNTEITVSSTKDRAIGILALGTNSNYLDCPGDSGGDENPYDEYEETVLINQHALSVVSRGNLTISVSGRDTASPDGGVIVPAPNEVLHSYGIYAQAGALVKLLGETSIDAPQAFGGGGIIMAYNDVKLGNSRIDGMAAEVKQQFKDSQLDPSVSDTEDFWLKNHEGGVYIQCAGELSVKRGINGWFNGELNATGGTVTVDRLDLTADSGKITVDNGGTLQITDHFSLTSRQIPIYENGSQVRTWDQHSSIGIMRNGRMVIAAQALLNDEAKNGQTSLSGQQIGSKLAEKDGTKLRNWNEIRNIGLGDNSAILRVTGLNGASSDDLKTIYSHLKNLCFEMKGERFVPVGIIDFANAEISGIPASENSNAISIDTLINLLESNPVRADSNEKLIGLTNDTLKTLTLNGVTGTDHIGASVKAVSLSDGTTLHVGGALTLNGYGENATNPLLAFNGSSNVLADVVIHDGSALTVGNILKARRGMIGNISVADHAKDAIISFVGPSSGGSAFTAKSISAAGHTLMVLNSDARIEGDVSAGSLTLSGGSLTLTGRGKLTLTGKGDAASSVAGVITADSLEGGGTLRIGNSASPGSLNVRTLSPGSTLFLDPLWTDNPDWYSASWLVVSGEDGASQLSLDSKVVIGMNSAAAFGTTREDAVAQAQELGLAYGPESVEAAVFIEKPVTLGSSGVLILDGSLSEISEMQLGAYEGGQLSLSPNSLLMLNIANAGGQAMVTANAVTVDADSRIGLINATVTDEPVSLFHVTGGDGSVRTTNLASPGEPADWSKILRTSDDMIDLDVVFEDGVLKYTAQRANAFTRFPGLFAAPLMNLLYADRANDVNSENKAVALLSRTAAYGDYGLASVGDAVALTNQMSALAVTAGVYNAALDAGKLISRSIESRTSLTESRPDPGLQLWADVSGTTNRADTLYGASGYDLDLAGTVFGADIDVTPCLRIGAAVSAGKGSGHARGAAVKTKTDTDFAGLSAYAAYRLDNAGLRADIGYLHTKSEIRGAYAYELNFDDDVGTDALTVGLSGECRVPLHSLDLIPHAGIRWTHFKADGVQSAFATDTDKLDLVTVPIGLKVSGTLSASSWMISPLVDLSVVPSVGSKKASSIIRYGTASANIRTQVVDTAPVQLSLGLNAAGGAWMFGGEWHLTAGSHDRLDNAFSLKARYAF
ncbi:MAG: autotransporter domain-containing protein [Sutterella sp.]|nr:autotransporter domain-containing protein [Sutterella sp.]